MPALSVPPERRALAQPVVAPQPVQQAPRAPHAVAGRQLRVAAAPAVRPVPQPLTLPDVRQPVAARQVP
jgi:hypothetical protein